MKTAYKKTDKKKPAIAFSLLLIFVTAGAFLFLLKHTGREQAKTNNTPATNNTSPINYNPPTQEEIDETERYKQNLPDVNKDPQQDTDTLKKVTPIITFADATEISGFVPGIVENDGTCTAKITHGSTSFTKSAKAFGNVNTTNCEPITLTTADFGESGTWTVSLSYKSTVSSGNSQTTSSFEVVK